MYQEAGACCIYILIRSARFTIVERGLKSKSRASSAQEQGYKYRQHSLICGAKTDKQHLLVSYSTITTVVGLVTFLW